MNIYIAIKNDYLNLKEIVNLRMINLIGGNTKFSINDIAITNTENKFKKGTFVKIIDGPKYMVSSNGETAHNYYQNELITMQEYEQQELNLFTDYKDVGGESGNPYIDLGISIPYTENKDIIEHLISCKSLIDIGIEPWYLLKDDIPYGIKFPLTDKWKKYFKYKYTREDINKTIQFELSKNSNIIGFSTKFGLPTLSENEVENLKKCIYQYQKNKETRKHNTKEFYIYIRKNVKPDDLKYLGSGDPNSVYMDPGIGVVKFYKSMRGYTSILIENDKDIKLKEKISYDELNKIDPERKILNHKYITDSYNVYNLIKDLPSFLYIKGVALYPKIANISNLFQRDEYQNVNKYIQQNKYQEIQNLIDKINPNTISDIKKNIPISQIYEYLDIDHSKDIPKIKNKDKITQLISDFKKINSEGYVHGDLQNNCRNIVITKSGQIKVIDIDSIHRIFIRNIASIAEMGRNSMYKDLLSLCDCLKDKINDDTKETIDKDIDYFFKDLYSKAVHQKKYWQIKYKQGKNKYTYDVNTQPKFEDGQFDTSGDIEFKYNWGLEVEFIMSLYKKHIEKVYDILLKNMK